MKRPMLLFLFVVMMVCPSLSSADETIEHILLNRTFWERIDWNNIQNTSLYKSKAWSSLGNYDVFSIYGYKEKVDFDGRKADFSMEEYKPKNAISFSLNANGKTGDMAMFERWRGLLIRQLGSEVVVYDGSEKGVNAFKQCQWDLVNTLATLSVFIQHDNLTDIATLRITYESVANAKRMKPVTYISCDIAGNKFDIGIDENNGKVKELDNTVKDWKAYISDKSYKLDINKFMTIDINRLNGKITGMMTDSGKIHPVSGSCEKLDTNARKF